MDLDEEEEDHEMDVDDEEEEPLPASPPPLSPLRTPPPVSDPLLILIFLLPLLLLWVDLSKVHCLPMRLVDLPPVWMIFVVERDILELMNGSTTTRDRLTLLEQDQVKNQEEIQRLKNRVQSANISATLAAMDMDRIEKTQDQDGKQIRELRHRLTSAEIRLEVASVDRYKLECELYSVRAQIHSIQQELYWRGFEENCPTESIDVLATYGDADLPELQEPSDTQ
ncbi:hypothetical protein Tco_0115528 [Tanacetum coccineum]